MWNTDLFINGKTVTFKIDTGAEVTAISKETWEKLGEPDLQSSNKLLHEGPATQQNCVRDYVIFTILPRLHQGLQQVCPGITHICNSRIGCNILVFRVIIRLKVQLG